MPADQVAEAEVSVLGAIALDNTAYDKVSPIVVADDFSGRNAPIWEAIDTLGRAGKPIDDITIVEQLRENGKLERVGGVVYVAGLTQAVPTAAHALSYAKILAENGLRKRVRHAGHGIAEMAEDRAISVNDLRETAQRNIFEATSRRGASGVVTVKQAMTSAFKRLEEIARRGDGLSGLSTGLADLDKITGGLRDGELIIIAARPAMGKTALALDIAKHGAMRCNAPAAIFSLETPADQLALRMAASEGRIDVKEMSVNLNHPAWSKMAGIAGKIAAAKISIFDCSSITVSEIKSRCRELAGREGLGLVVIDYLQLLSGERGENRNIEISDISRELKQLARELNIPVVVLSQLSRAVEQRSIKIPVMSDLRDSGAIEQDADVVIFIYREEYYLRENTPSSKVGVAELIIGKQRNGPTGSVMVAWQQHCTRFDNLAWDQ